MTAQCNVAEEKAVCDGQKKVYWSKSLHEQVLPMKIPVRSSLPTVGCKISLIQLVCTSSCLREEPEKQQGMNGKEKRKEGKKEN